MCNHRYAGPQIRKVIYIFSTVRSLGGPNLLIVQWSTVLWILKSWHKLYLLKPTYLELLLILQIIHYYSTKVRFIHLFSYHFIRFSNESISLLTSLMYTIYSYFILCLSPPPLYTHIFMKGFIRGPQTFSVHGTLNVSVIFSWCP